MRLSRLGFLKHIACAAIALAVLLCAAEVGLRLHEHSAATASARLSTVGCTICCPQCHHRLKPLTALKVAHPDTGKTTVLRTNSFGLRGAEPRVPKPDGVYRVLCLGDDATFAAETPDGRTACDRLQSLLKQRTSFEVEVINAGVPGYCPMLSLLQFKHALGSLQPDLIVLNFDMSDVADDHRYRRYAVVGADARLLVCPHPDTTQTAAPPPARRFLIVDWLKRRLGFHPTRQPAAEDLRDIDARHGRYAWLRDDPPDWSLYIDQTLQPLADLHASAQRTGAQLVVAIVPAPWQISPAASNSAEVRTAAGVPRNAGYKSRKPFETLAAFTRKHGIALCDPSKAMQAEENPERLYLQKAPRFSDRGHEVFAKQLAGCITRNTHGIWHADPFYEPRPPQQAEGPNGRRIN